MIKSILNSSICVLLLVLLGCSPDKGAFEIALPKDEAIISRGKLLVHGIAACGYCHGKQGRPGDLLVGGLPFEDRYGEVLASNITPARSGLQGWKVNDVISALRSSKSKSGRDLSPDVHQGYEWMSDQDLLAIASYLLNIPGVENEVQIREIGFIEKNTASIFSASAKDVGGFVPAIRQKDQVAFGKYLTDHVARCGSCHSRPGNIFLDEDYLGGGRSVNREGEVRVAPDITNSSEHGIGRWSKSDIVKYLGTGVTPDNRAISAQFCPTMFFRYAQPEELAAISRYLKGSS